MPKNLQGMTNNDRTYFESGHMVIQHLQDYVKESKDSSKDGYSICDLVCDDRIVRCA